jgi:hypothetical protein
LRRWSTLTLVALTLGFLAGEVGAYYHYRNDVDSIFVNFSIFVYYLLAVGLVISADRMIERARRRRRLREGRPQLRDLPRGH